MAAPSRGRGNRDVTDPASARLCALDGLVEDLLRDADDRARRRAEGLPPGPVTALAPLDRALGGHLVVGLHVLHGDPGAGKTALALQVAATCGAPALYVTAEMPALALLRRIIARVARLNVADLATGAIAGDRLRALAVEAVARAPWLAILDATTGPAPPDAILDALAATRDLARRRGDDGTAACQAGAVVVVDSGHAWAAAAGSGDGATEYERLNDALAALHDVAHRAAAAVLVVAERNRASAGVGRGGLHAAAGTRTWEYRAETVIDLDRTDDRPDVVTVRLPKNRHGPPSGGVALRWHAAQQRFEAM